MGECVEQMLDRIMPAIISGNRDILDEIKDLDDEVDILYEQIVEYMGKIGKGSLTSSQTTIFLGLMEAVGDVENIGDTIETNMVSLGRNRLNSNLLISPQTQEVLMGFHQVVQRAYLAAVHAVSQNNADMAQRVILMTDEVGRLTDAAASKQAMRLASDEPNRVQAYTIEVDVVEKLKRIFYLSRRMAQTVIADENI
jgi:phosphate:Na+ symporter